MSARYRQCLIRVSRDNRSVFHTATYDYEGKRTGQRAVSLGEKPYFDPNGVSRRQALGEL